VSRHSRPRRETDRRATPPSPAGLPGGVPPKPSGRHRAPKPPTNRAPAVLASAIVGATAAALSTAAASGNGGLAVVAADVTTLHGPSADQVLGTDALAAEVPAEEPMAGQQTLSAVAAQSRLADIRASRDAKRRQVLLAEAARPKWLAPMRKGTYVISSCFCPRWGTFHYGEDLAAPWGTPFYAAGDGVVIHAGPMSGYGNAIFVQHANGDVSVYGHEEKVLVTVGEKVKAGQLIGLVGALGQATGPHLHFEIRLGGENGEKADPVPWLAARGITL
jgi:murein DD-endopeptidase MepM/ murein hydrolase activator NlpD